MKLISLYIENFGGLSRYALEFETEITTIKEPNGFGKTTLAEFIRAMLYGFPRKGKSLDKNPREKYSPWNGGRYGGNLVFEHQGQRYRVERTFGPTPKTDTFTAIDLSTNKRTTRFTDELGQELFGLDADSFGRSTYLPQMQEGDVLATASIQAKLTALVEDSTDVANFDKAITALRAKRSALMPYRGAGGSVAETAAQISALQLKLDDAKEKEAQLRRMQDACNQVQQNMEETQLRLEQIGGKLEKAARQVVDCQRQQEYEQLCSRHRKTAERISFYRRRLPREEALRRAEMAADRLYSSGWSAGPAVMTEQLNCCRRLCEEYDHLQTKRLDIHRQLSEIYPEKQTTYGETKKFPVTMLWILSVVGLITAAGFAYVQKWTYASAAFAAGIAALAFGLTIFGIQNRKRRLVEKKMRTRQQERERKVTELQSQADVLDCAMEHCRAQITDIFAEHGLQPHPPQYRVALAQLELEASRSAQQVAQMQACFEEIGLSQEQDVQAALRQMREDFLAMQAAESFLRELSEQIKTMEQTYGEILYAEFSAAGDSRELKKEEQRLRSKLTEETAQVLRIRQNIQHLREQIADIPQMQERLEFYQQKICEDRERVRILDITMAFLQQAKDNLSLAYLGTIHSRFGDYLSQLNGEQREEYLIDTEFRVQLERQGSARELAYFSAGQTDLVMLCMRLALVDALFKDQEVFIILDDPFVNLDDAHMQQARCLLHKLAAKRQILYLTCHSSRTL